MKYEFNVYRQIVEEHVFWVAESKSLKGCVGQGDTPEEAIRELEANEIEWLETAEQLGIAIPAPKIRTELPYSGKFALRMSPYVHEQADQLAKELGVSLNHFICDAIAKYNEEVKRTLYSRPLPGTEEKFSAKYEYSENYRTDSVETCKVLHIHRANEDLEEM